MDNAQKIQKGRKFEDGNVGIKPINNMNLEEIGADGPTVCIAKCKVDICDSCDGVCFLGS